jgi:hypothetical protein
MAVTCGHGERVAGVCVAVEELDLRARVKVRRPWFEEVAVRMEEEYLCVGDLPCMVWKSCGWQMTAPAGTTPLVSPLAQVIMSGTTPNSTLHTATHCFLHRHCHCH